MKKAALKLEESLHIPASLNSRLYLLLPLQAQLQVLVSVSRRSTRSLPLRNHLAIQVTRRKAIVQQLLA